ncbi:hypothetical protein QFC19_002492 [Naganishia cerealis]|uniref:Uncharacterized protein n=1 Tax=Naganishia cerealis TaxID=610337 RepID=A0ACC2WAJ3_9TREE|nr:hypothetical protein QFC19_002492 [Naganishia cerealis]
MSEPTVPPAAPAQQTRKPRKRRRGPRKAQAKKRGDSSSSDSEDSSDDDAQANGNKVAPIKAAGAVKRARSDSSSSSSPAKPSVRHRRADSRSPSPPSTTIPPFVVPGKGKGKADAVAVGMDVDTLPTAEEETQVNGTRGSDSKPTTVEEKEREVQEKREKFRKVWLGKVVQAFGSELDQLRKVRICLAVISHHS